MALNLDARQRAMLQDMGITLWVPATPPAAPASAPAPAPSTAVAAAVPVASPTPETVVAAPVASATPQPTTSPQAVEVSTKNPPVEHTASTQAAPDSEASATQAGAADTATAHATPVYRAPAAASAPWFMAPVVHAYADTAADDSADAGWLVLVECADPQDPWAGDAGALLNQMLRALRLHHHPQVRIAPLTRQAPADAEQAANGPLQPLAPALQSAITEHRPARVLLMGLHAARAVLGRSEALGPLRAMEHALHAVPTVVTYDPAYLLRAPHAKPGAWSDLCRAHALRPPTA
ncbi:uracil-DNA glycosylase family protein [Comamonas sp. GB3 AK4-5]|uniref:uracil-DNA glycosylase family protein n=1 Tax=Comamonas sp. GB3 AK4-5 TaxID=3231487 RepID=UPI00351EFE8F